MSQVFYKLKDELTYQAPEKDSLDRLAFSSPYKKTAFLDERISNQFNDYLNDPSADANDEVQEIEKPMEPEGYYQKIGRAHV